MKLILFLSVMLVSVLPAFAWSIECGRVESILTSREVGPDGQYVPPTSDWEGINFTIRSEQGLAIWTGTNDKSVVQLIDTAYVANSVVCICKAKVNDKYLEIFGAGKNKKAAEFALAREGLGCLPVAAEQATQQETSKADAIRNKNR